MAEEIITSASIGDDTYILGDLETKERVAYEFQERKHAHWNENYLMYRDKVSTNRITQRQAINIPLLKETIQTRNAKTDEDPTLVFETLGNGNDEKRKEIVINELWSDYTDDLHLDILDNVEKKMHGLYGRTFKKLIWDWKKSCFKTSILDPFDVLIDPKVNPLDLETADYIILKNNYKSLRWVLANPNFREEGKTALKTYLDTKGGILAAAKSEEERVARNERLSQLNVTNFQDFGATDLVVELKECMVNVWHDDLKQFIRHVRTTGAGNALLLDVPLKKSTGVDFLPLVTWAEDVDINDVWNDAPADSVRTINKMINILVSQLLENRTYRNFGMFFYDSTNPRFTPGQFTPRPFGMYPVPGNPTDIIKPVEIQAITDTINEINFLIGIVEKATATTATDKGVPDQGGGKQTLGEIQLDLQQSQKISQSGAKYYRAAWKEYGEKWYKMMAANASKKITLNKKGSDGQYYEKEFANVDWKSAAGYEVKVLLKSEQAAKNQLELQKLSYVKDEFADNIEAQKIIKRKTLELIGWDPDDIQTVMGAEAQKATANSALNPAGGGLTPVAAGGGANPNPNNPVLPAPNGAVKSPIQMR